MYTTHLLWSGPQDITAVLHICTFPCCSLWDAVTIMFWELQWNGEKCEPCLLVPCNSHLPLLFIFTFLWILRPFWIYCSFYKILNTLLRVCPEKNPFFWSCIFFIIYPLERYPLYSCHGGNIFAIACYLVWTPHNIILTHNYYRLIVAMDHLCSIMWTTNNIY